MAVHRSTESCWESIRVFEREEGGLAWGTTNLASKERESQSTKGAGTFMVLLNTLKQFDLMLHEYKNMHSMIHIITIQFTIGLEKPKLDQYKFKTYYIKIEFYKYITYIYYFLVKNLFK